MEGAEPEALPFAKHHFNVAEYLSVAEGRSLWVNGDLHRGLVHGQDGELVDEEEAEGED